MGRLVLAVGLAVVGEAARGDELDRAGGGARTVGAGGVGLLDGGPMASLGNPALVVTHPASSEVTVELTWANARIALDPRPAGVDVPDSVGFVEPVGGWPEGRPRPLPTSKIAPRRDTTGLEPSHGLLVGTTVRPWEGRLGLGLMMAAPLGAIQAQRSYFADEREQAFSNRLAWMNLGGADRRLSVQGVAALQATDWLAVGAGIWLEQTVVTTARVYLSDVLDGQSAATNIETAVEGTLVPSVGVALGPWAGLRVAASWQGARETRIDTVSVVRTPVELDEGGEAVSTRDTFVMGHVPPRIEVGAAWTAPDETWAVGATGLWRGWSAWRTPHDEEVAGGLSDTVSLRAGGWWRPDGAWTLRAGAGWEPTPVPEQSGRTNLVDNTRLTASLGAGWRTDTIIGELSVDLAARLTHLVSRRHVKRADARDPVFDEVPDAVDPETGELAPETLGLQTNNPGFPGYRSEGWVGAFTLSILLRR